MFSLDKLKLKTLLAGAMVVALFLTIAISSFINIQQFSNMFYEITEDEHLPNVAERAKAQIKASLAIPIALSKGIAQNQYIQDWVLNGEDSEGLEQLKGYGHRLIKEQGASAFFWVSKLTNSYYTQNGLFKTISKDVPRDDWFYDFIDANQPLALNLDASEQSGGLTVYVNVLSKSASGEVLGVAGLGFDVSNIVKLVQQTQVGETGYMLLVDSNNVITAHPDNNFVKKELNQLPQYSDVANAISQSHKGYTLLDSMVADEASYVTITDLKDIGWKLITIFPKSEITNKVNTVVQLSMATALVLAIIFILLSLYIAKHVSHSISQVGDQLHSMSKSGGDLTMRLDDRANTELGHLAGGFNAILGKFADLVHEIKAAEAAINNGVGSLKHASHASLKDAEDQQGQTEMVASAITQMGQTISEVSSIAQQTADDTTSAVKDTHETNDVMVKLSNTMTELADSMKQSETTISELAGQAESINTVIDVINSISEQTNLLALNAAIEAARAGEQGRGFAVVADEVRTLASRTQDSTLEIRGQIEQLQSAAHSSLKSIQVGTRSSLELAEMAQSASNSLSTIRNRFDTISDGNHQVAAATEEQSSVVDHINASAQNISSMSNNILSSCRSQLSEIETLISQAQHMGNIIREFKV